MKKIFSSFKSFRSIYSKQIVKSQKFNHSHDHHGDISKCPYFQYQQQNTNLIRNKAPEFGGMAWWKDDFKKINLTDFQGTWVCL